MWQKLLDIQKRIAPEVVLELQKRSSILKQIEAHQPIGRPDTFEETEYDRKSFKERSGFPLYSGID